MSDTNTSTTHNGVAVEVVATFGDSVVGVKHAIDPRGGKTSRMTRALLAGGALAVAGSVGGFLYAAHVAAKNESDKAALVASGAPEWAFRPVQLPRSADALFAMGGALGLAALVWGMSRRKDERLSPRISIGTGDGCDFSAPAAPATAFDLVAPAANGDGFVLNLGGTLTGELANGAIAAPQLAITDGMRARVRCGAMTFHVAGVPAPRRQPNPLFATVDRRVASYLAGSVMAHAALLMILNALPPDADSLSASLDENENGVTRYVAVSNDVAKTEVSDGSEGMDGDRSDKPGQTAMGLAGTIGTDKPSPDPGKRKTTGDMTRDQAIEQARRAGVLDLWTGDRMAEMTGSDDISRGFDELDRPGGLDGDGDGSPEGSFGKSRHGVGPGGGGLIVEGDYRTIPGGVPGGDGFTFGPGHGHCATGHVCRGHDPVPPPVKIGPPIVSDDAVRGIVERYIKRNKNRIGYCYEKELLSKPELDGTVTASFLIGANGNVMSSTASGVDPVVSGCIADVIHGIEFPRLADAGTFQIKYPFILHAPKQP